MKTFTLEQIAQITGGMLSKAKDVAITNIAPPLLADENTLALALGEDEINNLSKTKAQAALVQLGVNIDGYSTIEVERPRLAMMKYGINDLRYLNSGDLRVLKQIGIK